MFYSGDHFLTTDRDVDSFVVLVFISLLSNLIIFFLYFDKRTTIQTDSLPWVSCPTRFKSPSYEKRV